MEPWKYVLLDKFQKEEKKHKKELNTSNGALLSHSYTTGPPIIPWGYVLLDTFQKKEQNCNSKIWGLCTYAVAFSSRQNLQQQAFRFRLEPKNISISAANKLMERTSWGMMARGHQKATRPVHCIALHLQMNDEFNIMFCIAMYCTAIFSWTAL